MSDMKILYGIKTDQMEELKEAIKGELGVFDVEVTSDIDRGTKSGILYEIQNRYDKNEPLVLVLSYRLEKNQPFSKGELVNFQNYLKNIRIIVVLSRADKNAGIMTELFNIGIYSAILEDEIADAEGNLSPLARLMVYGRSPADARQYYELDLNTSYADKVTVEAAYDIMVSSVVEVSEYLERAEWAKRRLNAEEFGMLLAKLPDEIKDVLSEDERYAGYYTEYIRQKLEALRDNGVPREESINSPDLSAFRDVLSNVLRRNMIAVAGAQPHIGSTYDSISIAHFLCEKGFKVGIVEYKQQTEHAFIKMAEAKKFKITDGCFTWKDVDYYPNFDLDEIGRLNNKNYNFIVVDFGLLTPDKYYYFTGCMMQCIVTGSRVWESDKLDEIFKTLKKEYLLGCNFLFYSTPPFAKKDIIRKMDPIKGIYFIGYDIDPFDGEADDRDTDGIAELFDDFVLAKKKPAKKRSLFGKE